MWDIYPVGVDARLLTDILNWLSRVIYAVSHEGIASIAPVSLS